MNADPPILTGQVKGGRKFYRQLLDMQDVLYTSALASDADPSERAACARAWEVLEERKRIMRGRPLPGSLKPAEKRARKTKEHAAPVIAQAPANANATAKYNGSQAHEQRAESVCEPSHTVVNGTLDKSA